jgi:hypothetical protein
MQFDVEFRYHNGTVQLTPDPDRTILGYDPARRFGGQEPALARFIRHHVPTVQDSYGLIANSADGYDLYLFSPRIVLPGYVAEAAQ